MVWTFVITVLAILTTVHVATHVQVSVAVHVLYIPVKYIRKVHESIFLASDWHHLDVKRIGLDGVQQTNVESVVGEV